MKANLPVGKQGDRPLLLKDGASVTSDVIHSTGVVVSDGVSDVILALPRPQNDFILVRLDEKHIHDLCVSEVMILCTIFGKPFKSNFDFG